MRRVLFAAVLGLALVLPTAVRPQVPALFGASGNPVWTGVITTTAASGNSPVMPLAGHTTCSVVTSNTAAGTNVTVFGSAQVVPNIGSQWFPNPNFGTTGVITVGTSPNTTTGNVANYPGGFYFSWTGNTGTLSAYATCSTAVQTAAGGGTSVTIVGPVPLPVTTSAPFPTAAPPVPAGIVATSYNAGGPSAPVTCIHEALTQLSTTLSTSTVLVPLAAGKSIYICSYALANAGAGNGGLYYASSNACPVTNPVTNVIFATFGNTNTTGGSGTGVTAIVPAGQALCFTNNSTSPTNGYATVMYEQFFRALRAEEVEERCSVPKRCVLYGLFKHLDKLLDHALTPP